MDHVNKTNIRLQGLCCNDISELIYIFIAYSIRVLLQHKF